MRSRLLFSGGDAFAPAPPAFPPEPLLPPPLVVVPVRLAPMADGGDVPVEMIINARRIASRRSSTEFAGLRRAGRCALGVLFVAVAGLRALGAGAAAPAARDVVVAVEVMLLPRRGRVGGTALGGSAGREDCGGGGGCDGC